MTLSFDEETIRRLVAPIVVEVVAKIGGKLDDDRLAYTEPEAARLLGISATQLRDARLRGEIVGTKVGGRNGYERSELIAYLARGRRDLR